MPGMQGGPLMHTIAAKATCFRIAMTDAFRDYQTRVRANADALAEALIDGGLGLITGGTDTHLMLVDLRESEWTGKAAEERLHEIDVTVNDPKAYTRPWTVTLRQTIVADSDLLDYVCQENERDVSHLVGQ